MEAEHIVVSDGHVALFVASLLAGAAPLVLAAMGETLTERAGVINLSLDGTILLAAMAAFVAALKTQSLLVGFGVGAFTGAMTAAVVAFMSLQLGRSQVAVGFVLTLMTKDLAYFLGNAYARLPGPQVPSLPVPWLEDLPGLGPALFQHSLVTYGSLLCLAVTWLFLYRSRLGLVVRAVGENPQAAFARGIHARRVQFLVTVLGGILVGLAGAAFSLSVKPGWGRPQGAEGIGWIALALVIFGGWHPFKVAVGAYLFALLQMLGITLQGLWPSIPSQVFQTAPFPLMIFTLVFMHVGERPEMERWAASRPWMGRLLRFLRARAPRALGRPVLPENPS